jgi:hypothetical protein
VSTGRRHFKKHIIRVSILLTLIVTACVLKGVVLVIADLIIDSVVFVFVGVAAGSRVQGSFVRFASVCLVSPCCALRPWAVVLGSRGGPLASLPGAGDARVSGSPC